MTTRSCHPWRAGLLAAALAILPSALAAQPAPAPTPAVKPVFTPKSATGMYAVGDTVAWTATLPSGQAPEPRGYLYKIRKNNLEVLETGMLDFAKGNNRTPDKQGEWEKRWREALATMVTGGRLSPVPRVMP